MSTEKPKRKRTKEQQSQVTESRKKMKEQVVKSKKTYKRKSKYPDEEE
ncbi:MAG: hypothetical protein GY816_16620 [Cytophagales bacterium]|nr:hypothetical protein [Cytophagales bacterium]